MYAQYTFKALVINCNKLENFVQHFSLRDQIANHIMHQNVQCLIDINQHVITLCESENLRIIILCVIVDEVLTIMHENEHQDDLQLTSNKLYVCLFQDEQITVANKVMMNTKSDRNCFRETNQTYYVWITNSATWTKISHLYQQVYTTITFIPVEIKGATHIIGSFLLMHYYEL